MAKHSNIVENTQPKKILAYLNIMFGDTKLGSIPFYEGNADHEHITQRILSGNKSVDDLTKHLNFTFNANRDKTQVSISVSDF